MQLPYIWHDTVVRDMQTYKPCALILLAHFAVFVLVLENYFWYTRGWGRALIDEIEEKLVSRPEYARWLVWPKKQAEATRW